MTLLGFFALGLVVYTYAGYPVLVAVWSRIAPHPSAQGAGLLHRDFQPTVSVCLSVYNGAQYVVDKIRSLQALDYPPDKIEILIYSDGSTDATELLVGEIAQTDPRVKLRVSKQRSGKPSALNALAEVAQGEVLLMTDVRQMVVPVALRRLLDALGDPAIGCVSGNLVLAGASGAGAYWRYETFIRGAEARLGSMVGVTGSLYALRRLDFQPMPPDLLLDDMFVPLCVARRRKGIVLATEAIAHDRACSDDQEFARKVRTIAGNYQLIAKLPWLLVPGKNPLWLAIVSHKLLRLVCPWALVILLGLSWLLAFAPRLSPGERGFWFALAAGQLVFYALAALGHRVGRLGALARTFVMLNVAALLGLWRFIRGAQPVTW
ncbi:MAG TPA: glycosyltransferase family 2 protein [Polyangiaceae bacterium]|nr:glycosyltransferase family 2 protein [Polyangiaceae bacterium]